MIDMSLMKLSLEKKRKLFHLSAILVPLLYATLPDHINTIILIAVAMVVGFCDFLRIFVQQFNAKVEGIFDAIMRSSEKTKLSGCTYMMLGFALTGMIFPTYVCIAAWLVLIFADAFAALVGQAANPGKSGKTIVGSFAFLTTALIVSICYLEFYGYNYHFLSIIGASIVAMLVEFYNKNLRLNDNFAIPIAFAGTFKLLEMIW